MFVSVVRLGNSYLKTNSIQATHPAYLQFKSVVISFLCASVFDKISKRAPNIFIVSLKKKSSTTAINFFGVEVSVICYNKKRQTPNFKVSVAWHFPALKLKNFLNLHTNIT